MKSRKTDVIMRKILAFYKSLVKPHGKAHFLLTISNRKIVRILDIGCGNDSASYVKKYCPKCYYVGIDVGDYNIDSGTKSKMDEYHVVKPEDFASKIEGFGNSFDAVISSHNIEHCNEPQRVLKAMLDSLKWGGVFYLAFPSEKSVTFPSRKGTLNFYDDKTHNWCPEWDFIINILNENDIKINYACRNYSPIIYRLIGKMNEHNSKKQCKVLRGTWEYWGFESVIWGKKQ